MPGIRIAEADRQRINPKFFCSKCKLLLIEPMQTPCGHLMCQSCVEEMFSFSNPLCPKDATKLKKEQVFLDGYTKRELLGLPLQCPNSDCDWSGIYKGLQDHLNCCAHSLIQCVHPQCKQDVKRFLLGRHLETECLHREVACTYCNGTFSLNTLKEHVDNECLEAPLTCKHCETADIPRKDMAIHEKLECEEIPAECKYKAIGCDHGKVSKRKELHVHQSEGIVIHMGLLLTFALEIFNKVQSLLPRMEILPMIEVALEEMKQKMVSFSRDVKALSLKFVSMLKTIAGLEKKVSDLEARVGEGRNDPRAAPDMNRMETKLSDLIKNMEKLAEKVRKLENQDREKTATIERFKARLDQADHSMALTTVTLSEIDLSNQSNSTTSSNGILVWKIEAVARRRQEAVSGAQIAIYSPSFYSGQFGYKMCARIYMNGDGFGKGTHISLFFVIMKGEHDALLPWPFQKKITMMLLDQNNGEHNIDSFRSDPESSSFQRPTNNMNVASGSPLFMALDGLSNRTYIKDDAMFIKIIVD